MPAIRQFRDALVFVPCWIALDWASYIHPLGPFNITPWNPQAAFAITWMFLSGLHHVPVVLFAIFLADYLVRGFSAGYEVSLLTSTVLALGYAGIAWTLRSGAHLSANFSSVRDLARFAPIVAAGTALVGLAFVGVLLLSGALASQFFADAWFRFWMGDVVGVLVTAPLLLVTADIERRQALKTMATRPETLVQLTVLLATLWLVFNGRGEPSEYFYFLFLPLIWITARTGLIGAVLSLGIVQVGVVVGIYDEGTSTLSMLHLQSLVAVLTLTGLLLGVMVDERQRATENAKESLRLAAAGEMAGAITHEISQPLTALTNYGRSAQMLLDRGDAAEVSVILQKMLAECERAAEVAKRLRDFFRAGTTRLEIVQVAALMDAAAGIGRKLIGSTTISLHTQYAPGLAPLLVDRLQIELVLRNLLANSVEALTVHSKQQGTIRILAQHHDREHVRIVVIDSGVGVPAAQRQQVFEPFVSGKSTGMGLGLAISRAIARAHGGELEIQETPHGEFHLILPCSIRHDE